MDTFFNRIIADLFPSQLLIYWKNWALILSLSVEKLLPTMSKENDVAMWQNGVWWTVSSSEWK